MTRVIRYAVALAVVLLTGCGVSRPTLDLATVRQSESVIYVHNGAELKEISIQSGQARILFSADDGVIRNPSLSPDGRKVALLTARKRRPLERQKATLSVYDLEGEKPSELGEFKYSFDIQNYRSALSSQGFSSSLSTGERREDPWMSRPVWSPDGHRILVADHNGIHMIALDSDSAETISIDDIRQAVWVPGRDSEPAGARAAATDGARIYRADFGDGAIDTLVGSSSTLGIFDNTDIRALTFSHFGATLAFADDRQMYVLDSAGSKTLVHKSSAPIYWIAWLPGDTALVFLSGKRDRAFGGGQGTRIRGTFLLSTVSLTTGEEVKLYDQVDMDVRDATPSLSSDARHVVLSSRNKNSRHTLFLIATDGSGQARLGKDKSCYFPIWQEQPNEH